MKTILITAPSYDPVTRHFSYWVSFVIDHINNLPDVEAIVLRDEEAYEQKFTEKLQLHEPSMVFFNGHGNETSVAGHEGSILASSENGTHKQLKGAIIHSLARSSGRVLGEECVKIGVRAFIGYNDEFKFFYTIDDPAAQGHDDTAALFLEPAHQPMLSLASGKDPGSAFNDARRMYRKNFLEAYANNMDDDVLKILLDDLKRFVLHEQATSNP